MIGKLFSKIIGSRNDRILRRMSHAVVEINRLEPEMQRLSDAQLRAKTDLFKTRLADGESIRDLLCEAFAVVREVGVRGLDMRLFDVQLMGGMALNDGKIAEMRTGEGKTLMATLPAYLNALTGNGVHIVTVNDYLASQLSHCFRAAGLRGSSKLAWGVSRIPMTFSLSWHSRQASAPSPEYGCCAEADTASRITGSSSPTLPHSVSRDRFSIRWMSRAW